MAAWMRNPTHWKNSCFHCSGMLASSLTDWINAPLAGSFRMAEIPSA